jgi:4-hydroxybenzoyl-CoA thioesterase
VTPSFRGSYPLRFAHCDPAGIAYYPRYFEICDGAIEDWTEVAIGVSRAEMHMERRLALPTVALEATFSAPGRLGDLLDIEVYTEEVGRTSLRLGVEVSTGGEPRFSVKYTQVLVSMDTGRPVPWPQAWQERLEKRTIEGKPL